ncbi:hypothetical protein [Luethyella okanaganae]|uniref:Uncharacterized protein n=1 Tax=Luethyella okanaganae TaxID=69372 RepID=A0ABW1VIK6_9MICO
MASLVLVAGTAVPTNVSGESPVTIGEFGHFGAGASAGVAGTLRLNGKLHDGGSSDPVIDERGSFFRSYPTVALPTGDYEYQVLAAGELNPSDESFIGPRGGCQFMCKPRPRPKEEATGVQEFS